MGREIIPKHLVNPGEKILYSVGCREDGTYSGCVLIITDKHLYINGNFHLSEYSRKKHLVKGFKLINLNSVFYVRENVRRHTPLISLSFLFSFILLYFVYGHLQTPPAHPTPYFLYESLVFILAAGTFLAYVLIKQRYVIVQYKEGEAVFRKDPEGKGHAREAMKVISSLRSFIVS